MKVDDVHVIKISEMTTGKKSGIEQKTMDLMKVSKSGRVHDKSIEETKSIDLISVDSEEFSKDDGDDISFDEGRLQQWNFREFSMQFVSLLAGVILLFGCLVNGAWSITDFVKDILSNEDEWTDIDYGWNLFNDDEEEFFQSRHIIIAIVVLSWNVGAIIGGIFGAFVVPVLSNKTVYTLGSVLMFLSGIALTKHTSPFYCVKARFIIGFVFAMIQVAIIVQAAESTTKKVRRWMLVIVAYAGAVAFLLSITLFYYYDDREVVTYSEENPALYIISYTMMGLSLLALVFNLICTKDTVPFLLNRGEETKAFKEMTRLKVEHLSMLDIRYEYERIRFDVTQAQLEGNRNLGSRMNYGPLTTMCGVRILNLLFTSVPMTLLLIWAPAETDDNTTVTERSYNFFPRNVTTTASTVDFEDETDTEQLVHPLYTLAVVQIFRILTSSIFVIKGNKYFFNRSCYKLAFACGVALLTWYIARIIFEPVEWLAKILYFPVIFTIMMSFTGLPVPLEIIQLSQSADSYSRIKNTWSLALAIFIENLFHMLLIGQMDMLFGVMFVFCVNGIAMMYFSFWLIKAMPNVVAIHPITMAIVARYPFKRTENEQTIHI